MAERRASKRERRKPELFGTFGAAEDAEDVEPQQHCSDDEEEEEKEHRPRKRARRQRRRAADSEADEEEEAPAAGRVGGSGHGSTKRAPCQPRKQQAREAAELPLPAQPLSRADFLGALHACPTLIDMILQQDGLRTPTLLARDAANLAVALCASTQQMDGAWRVIAARAAGGEGFAGTTEQALEAAKAAVKGDPARSQRCTTTTAKQDYRLSDKDLAGLECELQRNPVFWSAAPTRLYSVLECLAMAHRKYGDLAGIRAAKAKAQERGQKVKATRQGNSEWRKEEIKEAAEAASLAWAKYASSLEVTSFIKHGKDPAAEVAAGLKEAERDAAKKAERKRKLQQRLEKEGLGFPARDRTVQQYIAGEGKQTLASVVAALKKAEDERQAVDVRREALKQRLLDEGMNDLVEHGSYLLQYGITGAAQYISRGEGSMEELVAAARDALNKRAERQQEEAQRQQRQQELLELWTAGGFEAPFGHSYGAEGYNYIWQGTGTAQQAYEAEVARRASQAAAQQRREQVHALLQADGLSLRECTGCTRIQQHLANVVSFADEQLLAAARTHIKQERERHRLQRAEAERSGRQATMTQLLTDAGLHSFYAFTVPAVVAYIASGQGSWRDALAAAREYHKQHAGAAAPGAAAAAAAAAVAAAGDEPLE